MGVFAISYCFSRPQTARKFHRAFHCSLWSAAACCRLCSCGVAPAPERRKLAHSKKDAPRIVQKPFPGFQGLSALGIESYDPTTNEALIVGRGSIPQDNGVGFSKKLFAPRFGFAYQLGNNTVIRSGYGITYHSHPWGAQALRGWYPLTIVAVFDGINGFQPVTTDPNYVAAGIPNQPLGPNVGIPPVCCPDISAGRVKLPLYA